MMTPKLGLSALMLLGGLGFPSLYLSTESCGCSSTDIDADGTCDVEDCAPEDPQSYPDAPEVCDGVDNNCDGSADENVGSPWYQDADGDGYGNPSSTMIACSAPEGYVENGEDCGDGDGAVNPGAVETCDQVDQDCDGEVDEGAGWSWYRDEDGDGFGNPYSERLICVDPETVTGYKLSYDGLDYVKINDYHEADCFDSFREEFGDGQDYHPDWHPDDPEYLEGNVVENLNMGQDKNCDGAIEILIDAVNGEGPRRLDIPLMGGIFEVAIEPIRYLTQQEKEGKFTLVLERDPHLADPAVRRALYLKGTAENGVTLLGPQLSLKLFLNGVEVGPTFFQDHYPFTAAIRYPLQGSTIQNYELSPDYVSVYKVELGEAGPQLISPELFRTGEGNFANGEYWAEVEHHSFSIYVTVYDEDLLIFRPVYNTLDYATVEDETSPTPQPVVRLHEEEGTRQEFESTRRWEFSLLEITPTPEPTPVPCQGWRCPPPTPTPTPEPTPPSSTQAQYDNADFRVGFYVKQFNDGSLSEQQLDYSLTPGYWRAAALVAHALPDDPDSNYKVTSTIVNKTGVDLDVEQFVAFAANTIRVDPLDALDSCSSTAKKWAIGGSPFANMAREVYCPNEGSQYLQCLDFRDPSDVKDVNYIDDLYVESNGESRLLADPFDCMRFRVCGTRVFADQDLDGWGTDGEYESDGTSLVFHESWKVFCSEDLTWNSDRTQGHILVDGIRFITQGGDCNDHDDSQHPNTPGASFGDPDYVVDDPDIMWTGFDERLADKNCDGIDGDLSRSVFVSKRAPNTTTDLLLDGDGDGFRDRDGSLEAPFETIQEAINAADAERPYVLLGCTVGDSGNGCEAFSESIALKNGISLIGGYEDYQWSGVLAIDEDGNEILDQNCSIRIHNPWDTNDQYHDEYLPGDYADPVPCFNRRENIWVSLTSPLRTGITVTGYSDKGMIHNIRVTTQSTSEQDGEGNGFSTHALVLTNVSRNLRILGNRLEPGDAAVGREGADHDEPCDPVEGDNGAPGSLVTGGAGGSGGGVGHDGGRGATQTCEQIDQCSYPAQAGSPVDAGGAAGSSYTLESGGNGYPGGTGKEGNNGSGSQGSNDPIVEGSGRDTWVHGGPGKDASGATSGGGGGGGGGGLCCTKWDAKLVCYEFNQSAGGGGGGGGAPGCPGKGGKGGGYRLGILAISSPEFADPSKDNSFEPGNPGNGGSGGSGNDGALGGNGGDGQICWGLAGAAGKGGSGGKGGYGGDGGKGGDGQSLSFLAH